MKIAFTSCISYDAFPIQEEWNYIKGKEPDYLFLLGDSIYMDYGVFGSAHNKAPRKYSNSEFESKMKQEYQNQFTKVKSFRELLDSVKDNFYAIYDDHDFAWDNCHGTEVRASSKGDSRDKREISRNLFHEYTNCSTNLPHAYYAIDIENLARVIFIDNRFDSGNGKLLSDEQFAFIENKLQHEMLYTIICGGLTLNRGHENWAKYPSELRKLCDLLKGKDKVIFLGGDIHYNEFVKPKKYRSRDDNPLQYEYTTPCQLISSGMQVNYFGIGRPISWDDKHCWALLELTPNDAKVTFYKRDKPQTNLSHKANEWIRTHL